MTTEKDMSDKQLQVADGNQLATVIADPIQLLARAVEKGVDVEQLRELMALEREWRADKAKAEYAAAMTKFGTLRQVVEHNRTGKTAGNATFSYTDFPTLVSAVTPWMSQCGLSFSHRHDAPVMKSDGGVAHILVYCRIMHSAGHSEEFMYPAVPDGRLDGKVSPSQLIQLAITYAKRQTLAEGLGIATAEDRDDDDAQKPVDLITEKQAADLTALMDECIKNKSAFLGWLKVEKISDLPASQYARAVAECEKKRKAS